jgi:aspartate racemase
MAAIYGKRGIKSGYKSRPRALLLEAARQLLTDGAELIIAGCTEVSLVLGESKSAPCPVIDPMEVIARVAVERARAGASTLRDSEDSAKAMRSSVGV